MFKELWEMFFAPAVKEQKRSSEYDEATARWTQRNEEARRAGCKCGKPWTRRKVMADNMGAIPVHFYSCDEHFGVTHWGSHGDGPWFPTNKLTDEELRAEGYRW